MTPIHLLVVEDSEDDTILILSRLRRDGMDVTHERVDTAGAAAVSSPISPETRMNGTSSPLARRRSSAPMALKVGRL